MQRRWTGKFGLGASRSRNYSVLASDRRIMHPKLVFLRERKFEVVS